MTGQLQTSHELVTQKLLPVNSMFKHSYDHAKKSLQGGVNVIHESITVIKEEFIGIYDKAATYMNKMALPVNNFLKDLTQIDAEFQAELGPSTTRHGIVPIEEALKGRMEENY